MTSFSTLGLLEPLQRAVREAGYATPTPIQTQAIPELLRGKDLLGCAKTGTGKTAAFALPILQKLASGKAQKHVVRALVVVPTRELATQVAESFATYGRFLKLHVATVFGGVGQMPQVKALERGVDVLVATPGRLVDLMGQGYAKLGAVEVLVLDEADHMLDLGFLPDVRRIIAKLPRTRQNLFFSATMPPPIAELADGILHDPVKVFVTPAASTVETIEQRVHFVDKASKPDLLAEVLLQPGVDLALVFTRTKHGADRVAKRLARDGIPAAAIHGNKSQGQRERVLDSFRDGKLHVLVATDIAARGIDIDGITHVVNFDLPNVPETYVHRIGRTARAGASGVAISFCDREERPYLRDIQKLIKREIPVAGRVANPKLRFEDRRMTEDERFGRTKSTAASAEAESGAHAEHDAPLDHRGHGHARPAAARKPHAADEAGRDEGAHRGVRRSADHADVDHRAPRHHEDRSEREGRTGHFPQTPAARAGHPSKHAHETDHGHGTKHRPARPGHHGTRGGDHRAAREERRPDGHSEGRRHGGRTAGGAGVPRPGASGAHGDAHRGSHHTEHGARSHGRAHHAGEAHGRHAAGSGRDAHGSKPGHGGHRSGGKAKVGSRRPHRFR